MPKSQCPECGRQLKPNANYCSYCGVNLGKKSDLTPTPAPQETSTSPTIEQEESPPPTKEAMPPMVEAALILRGKLETLQTQKATLDEEQETIRVKQLVGEITESEAKKELDKLKSRLDPISKEIEQIEKKAITPLEQLQQDKKVQEGRLQRLEDLRNSGEVEEAIYKRLSTEYSNKLNEINHQLETEIASAHFWLVQLEQRKQELEFEKETLQVRARIDEVSKREVNKQLKSLDEELNKINSVIAGLRAILGTHPTLTKPTEKISIKVKKKVPASKCAFCGAKISQGSKYCYTCGRLLPS